MIRDLMDRYYRWRHAYAMARGDMPAVRYWQRRLEREWD
jgi:hypothetical protein